MTRIAIIAAACFVMGSARAQTVGLQSDCVGFEINGPTHPVECPGPFLAQWPANGPGEYNWPLIEKCAEKTQPQIPVNDAERYAMEIEYRQISECRIMLDARHAGWKAAGGGDDPFPPQPMMRDGDLGYWSKKP